MSDILVPVSNMHVIPLSTPSIPVFPLTAFEHNLTERLSETPAKPIRVFLTTESGVTCKKIHAWFSPHYKKWTVHSKLYDGSSCRGSESELLSAAVSFWYQKLLTFTRCSYCDRASSVKIRFTSTHLCESCQFLELNPILAKQTEESSNLCTICYEHLDKCGGAVITSCKHKFHSLCLGKSLVNRHTCPMCRAAVTSIHYLNHVEEGLTLHHLKVPMDVDEMGSVEESSSDDDESDPYDDDESDDDSDAAEGS